ncbi:MAG: hypothetical protein ACOWWR_18400 [Eubacteriales bacterium]
MPEKVLEFRAELKKFEKKKLVSGDWGIQIILNVNDYTGLFAALETLQQAGNKDGDVMVIMYPGKDFQLNNNKREEDNG